MLALGLLLASHFTARKGIPFAVPASLYLAFTAVEGVMLAFIFAVFSASTITTAFGGALLIFAVMTIYGLTTRRDLAGLDQLCLVGLLGLVVAGLFNIFLLQSVGLSLITIPIFMGLTAWETREIKREAQRAASDGDSEAARRLAGVGAAGLFLNMFLALLDLLSLDFSGWGGK